MCSRYELNADARELGARFRLTVPPPPNRAEVHPTDPALVIGPDGGRLARWGLEAAWSKRPLINARAESLAERDAFRRLLTARVLIPATLWWEWRVAADGRGRTKMRLRPAGDGAFAFAGLLDGERFTMITRAAQASIADVHERMPALLRPADEALWLDPTRPFAEAAAALAPPDAVIEAVPEAPSAQGDLFG